MKKVFNVCSVAFACALGVATPMVLAQTIKADDANTAAQREVAGQAGKQLYLLIGPSRYESAYLLVSERLILGEQKASVDDASTLSLKLLTKSHVFGSDDLIPLKDAKGFYVEKRGEVGLFSADTSGGKVEDKSYLRHWPILDYPNSKDWRAVVKVVGTAYYSDPARVAENASLVPNVDELSGRSVAFVSESEAKRWMDDVKQKHLAAQKQREAQEALAKQEAQKKTEQRQAKIAANLAEMAKAPRGSEDSCKRIVDGHYVVTLDPQYTDATCQFGGLVPVDQLSKAGWLIVNKVRNNDGVVTDYFIRKAR